MAKARVQLETRGPLIAKAKEAKVQVYLHMYENSHG
jgi:hypothetical protein